MVGGEAHLKGALARGAVHKSTGAGGVDLYFFPVKSFGKSEEVGFPFL